MTRTAVACASPSAQARSWTRHGTTQRPLQRRDPRRPGAQVRLLLADAGPDAAEGHAQHGRRRGQAGLQDARGRPAAAGGRSRARSRTSGAPASPWRRSSCARACRSGSPSRCAASARTSSSTASSSIALPRLRDFRGLNPRSFDGRGNYSMGIREQIIFPEIDYDNIDQVRGLDVTFTTSAQTDAEAFALLDGARHAVRPRRAPGRLRDARAGTRRRVDQEI